MSLMSNAGIVLFWPCKRLLLLFSFFANIRVFEKHRNHKWQKVLVFFSFYFLPYFPFNIYFHHYEIKTWIGILSFL